jgi:hypothetical protein
MRVSLCPSGEKILDEKEGKTMHVISWVCFVLLILGNAREALPRSMPRCCPATYKRATRGNGRHGLCGP